MAFPKPNFTQTPNLFFDDSLRKIKSFAELKVVLAVVRQTFGWRKDSDKLSHSQLAKLTGLTRRGVINGVNKALEHGFLERQPSGQTFTYRLALVNGVHQLGDVTSEQDSPEVVNGSDQQLVNEVDTQKKEIKEKKETPHSRLFAFHAERVGKVLNGGKQGKAISSILSAFSESDAIDCYRWVETWSDATDWAVVASKIGPWLAGRKRGNGHAEPVAHDAAWHAKQAELARRAGREYRPSAT